MNNRDKPLSNDLIILSKIYEYTKIKKEPLWFTKLTELLEGKLSLKKSKSIRSAVSKSEDKLYDLCMIDKHYRNVNGLMTCCYELDEDVEEFAKVIYENHKGDIK